MPEVLRTRGFRFFFFSREGRAPRHIHVERAESRGFRSHELTVLRRLIEENQHEFIHAWDMHHNQ